MSAQRKLPVETLREWIRHANENLGVAEREMQYEVPAYPSGLTIYSQRR